MKSKINTLESMKNTETSFVQLSSDVASSKINSFKDMAHGLESSLDGPGDEMLLLKKAKEESDSDQDEEEDSTSFYTTATSARRTGGKGLAQKGSQLDA
jgi:hypothetical protein